MGKLTISMVIFHSYVKLPEGNPNSIPRVNLSKNILWSQICGLIPNKKHGFWGVFNTRGISYQHTHTLSIVYGHTCVNNLICIYIYTYMLMTHNISIYGTSKWVCLKMLHSSHPWFTIIFPMNMIFRLILWRSWGHKKTRCFMILTTGLWRRCDLVGIRNYVNGKPLK